MLDILGIYFESPVFYEDEVENGRTAEYRIRSIDVFGRTSEYSDVIKPQGGKGNSTKCSFNGCTGVLR